MAEQFANDAVTTLSGSITSGSTSIAVVDGSKFPATGNFRIRIDNEYILCTARTGNTLTTTAPNRGIEASTAAAHSSGATVRQVITAGGLVQLAADGGHAQSHALTSTSDHSASGLTAGWVISADSATTFSWQQLLHTDLGSVGTDDHHSASHTITSASHTGSLTPTSSLYTGVVQASRVTAATALTTTFATIASMAIAAGEVWRFDVILHLNPTADTSDLRVQWSLPANVTWFHFQSGGLDDAAASSTGATDSQVYTAAPAGNQYGGLGATDTGIHLVGMVISSTGAGTCNFQAREDAADTVIENGALMAWRVV